MHYTKNKIIALVLLSFSLFSCEKERNERPYGTLIEVPTEVNTLQEAIKTAQPMDTIMIYPGEYPEWDLEINKPLNIFSTFLYSADSNIINQTIINGNRQSRIFTISNIADTVCMNGFTITKGHAKSKFPEEPEFISYNGGGIYCYNANLKLFNMSITHNSASEPNSRGNGGGLYIDSAFVLFDNVHLLDNYGLNTGGAFYCKSSTLKIYNSLIDSNSTYYGGAPISIFSSVLDFRNVLFMDNENRVKLSPDFIIYSSDGVFEDVKTINDSVYFKNSAIKLINCDIPYQ